MYMYTTINLKKKHFWSFAQRCIYVIQSLFKKLETAKEPERTRIGGETEQHINKIYYSDRKSFQKSTMKYTFIMKNNFVSTKFIHFNFLSALF